MNLGKISADVLGKSIIVNPSGTFTNSGMLEAKNGGTLFVNGTWTNSSTIVATDSTLSLSGTWNNTGTISATNSTTNLGGSFTLANLGTFNRTTGTVNLTGHAGQHGHDAHAQCHDRLLEPGRRHAEERDVERIGRCEAGGHDVRRDAGRSDGQWRPGPVGIQHDRDDRQWSGAQRHCDVGRSVSDVLQHGSQTLGGTGTVVFNDGPYQALMANTNNMTLTIGAGDHDPRRQWSGGQHGHGALIGLSG